MRVAERDLCGGRAMVLTEGGIGVEKGDVTLCGSPITLSDRRQPITGESRIWIWGVLPDRGRVFPH